MSTVNTNGRDLPLVMRYPEVTLTVAVGLLGAVLWLSGFSEAAHWLFGGFAIVIGAIAAVRIVQQLRDKHFGIDILAVIAVAATVAVGEVVASMIIVLMVSGGKALEDFAQGRARRELNALLDREPRTAHRLVPGSSKVEEISAEQVAVGDVLLVRSGEVVPVDGLLDSASAAVDESSLTGESLPRTLLRGESVLSGSVNGAAAATIVATARAENSQYQAIIGLVKQASANRAPVVRLADRYAIPFTAVSLIIAGVAWAISGDPVRFAEVLVLATPCPLVLAAPIAFMGGMSRAARNGIIVKGGGVLELLSRARTGVFDKTGTLTHGSPEIVKIIAAPPFDSGSVLRLAASAEQASSHVLASSIVTAARERGMVLLPVLDSTEVAARGVSAVLDKHVVAVGTLAFVKTIAPDASATPLVGGELAIYVAIDDRFAGSIVATDSIRSNSAATITALRNQGLSRVLMLTGDAQATADHVAQAVGISEVRADCLPIDKVDTVHNITERPVMMVGDGVNDSPVLASADVGIAMGARGASAASEAAAAVILVDDISRVALAVEIGQNTVRIALQSIWLGIILSVGLMVIAAFGMIPATLGAGIQEIVDLATILNALRTLRPTAESGINNAVYTFHRESTEAAGPVEPESLRS